MKAINKKVKLNLEGVDGNAFVLMGAFSRAARHQGWSESDIKSVLDDAKSSDYDHLVATLVSHCDDIEDDE